jgi:hypothetical protein
VLHVRLGKRRTTVSVDNIISEYYYWAYKAIRHDAGEPNTTPRELT